MESQTQVFLVRHGYTEWNKEHRFQGQHDSNLLQEGIDGAIRIGKILAHIDKCSKIKFDAIFSSPLGRAKHTATLIKHQFPKNSFNQS